MWNGLGYNVICWLTKVGFRDHCGGCLSFVSFEHRSVGLHV